MAKSKRNFYANRIGSGKDSLRDAYRKAHDELVQKIIWAANATELGRFWSQPTGAAYREGKLVRYGVLGSADISGIIVGGFRIEIEVKTGAAVQQKNQHNFQAMITRYNGLYFVAHSVEEAVSFIKAAAARKTECKIS